MADTRRPARLVRLASALVVVLAVAVPVKFATDWWGDPALLPRRQTAAAELSPRLRERAAAIAAMPPSAAPIALSYHDLQPTPTNDVYVLTPTQFDEQMALLELAGYTAISGAELVAYVRDGAALPANAVHITFDDGTAGVWTYGDRILDRYGMRATVFLITAVVGTRQPYYLRWNEIRRMAAGDRWDFGGHTHDGHRRVPVTASGDVGAFLGYRMWLADEGRLERRSEWRDRVAADLDANIAALAAHDLDGALTLSFPFSNDGHPTNDAALAGLLAELVDERFALRFINEPRGGLVTAEQADAGLVERFAVRAATTPDELLDLLEASRG